LKLSLCQLGNLNFEIMTNKRLSTTFNTTNTFIACHPNDHSSRDMIGAYRSLNDELACALRGSNLSANHIAMG
jgi:hypothetical protein